jgi:predicted metal-dependent peptidase
LKCEKDEFLNKIQDILKNICDEISLKEVDDYRNSLLKYLKYAKEEKITGLKKGIADLSELMLFEKEKEMDDLLFYIHQTLLTSLIYSDKIKSGKLLSVG